MTSLKTAMFLVDICRVSIYRVGSFLARIRWLSEQNMDAITPEAIWVRTEVVGYAHLNILR